MVVQLVPEANRAAAVEQDVFVRLVVAGGDPWSHRHLLVPAQAVLEEAQVPRLGIAAVLDPAAEEEVFHVEVEPVGLVGGRARGDLGGQLGDDHLVGVDDQHPLVAEREVVERPVLLLGVGAVEVELDHGRAMFGGDPRGLVAALAVDDEDLVGPGQRGQAPPEVGGLILDRDDDADLGTLGGGHLGGPLRERCGPGAGEPLRLGGPALKSSG